MVKKLISALAAMVLSACATVNTPQPRAANKPQPSKFQTSEMEQCQGCPAEGHFLLSVANNSTARLFVQAAVNGKPKSFLLDTGAAKSMLMTDDDIKQIPSVGRTSFSGADMVPRECDWIRVNSFKVAGHNFSNAPFTRCDPYDSIPSNLGLEYLKFYILYLDFEKMRFELKGTAPEGVVTSDLKILKSGQIAIPVYFGSDAVDAIFDTGCAMTVVDLEFARSHPSLFAQVTVNRNGQDLAIDSPMRDATGRTLIGQVFVASDFKIGNVLFKKQIVTVFPFSKDLRNTLQASIVLGATTIMNANWMINFKDKKWSASPISQKTAGH